MTVLPLHIRLRPQRLAAAVFGSLGLTVAFAYTTDRVDVKSRDFCSHLPQLVGTLPGLGQTRHVQVA